jgi:hypothetical protein
MFLERYKNCLSLLYYIFLLIPHQFQLAGFCEITISLNQNLSLHFVMVIYLEFWFLVVTPQNSKFWNMTKIH